MLFRDCTFLFLNLGPEFLDFPSCFFFRVDLINPGPKASELKGRARGKPSLLAAARPMRAILPAPANVGRGSSMGLPRARQAFPLSGKEWDRPGRRGCLMGRGQERGGGEVENRDERLRETECT